MRKLVVIGGLAALIAAASAFGGRERLHQNRQTAPIFVRQLYVTVRGANATVACPRRWAVAAGGMDRSFASTGGAIGSWVEGERAWVFRVESSARFHGFVTCIRSKPGVTISWGSAKRAVWSGAGEEWILCPAGQKPTGWGFDVRLAPPGPLGGLTPPRRMEVSFTTTRPQPDGWDIGMVAKGARGEVRIRCLRPQTRGSARYRIETRRVGRTVRLGPRERRQLTQRCPRGWSPVSPGWETPSEDEALRAIVQGFITRRGAGTYRATNVTEETLQVGIHLVCVRNVAQAVR